jgi:hypothetical protein
VLMPTTKQLRKDIAKHYRDEFRKMETNSAYEPISYN